MANIGVPLYLQESEDRFHKSGTKADVYEKNISTTYKDHELDLKKIPQLPVLLNVLQPQICRKCRQKKSCSFGYKINFQDYLNIVNPKKSISPVCDQSTEVSFDSLHILENLAGKCLCDVKLQKRSRSISNMVNFNEEELLGNKTRSPSKWTFESVETILRRKTLRKFPILFESFPPDAVIERASSPCHFKVSNLISSTFHTKSENTEAGEIPVGVHSYDGKACHNRVLSSSSATSSSSFYSAACTGGFATSALLHCIWDGNVPTFLFSVDDCRGEVLVASPMKIKCSVERALDYIYIFHSIKFKGKRSLNHVARASSFIGRMKVSSSLSLASGQSRCMETQFVLFGAKEHKSSDNRNSPSNVTRGNGLSQKVAEIFRPSMSPLLRASSQFENLRELLKSELSVADGKDKENYIAKDFRPNDELVAIVVKDYGYESTNQVDFGGWGLKFLPKMKIHDDNSRDDSSSEEHTRSENSTKIVNVIVPAGYHGGPVTEPGGPSSIIERWKSEGRCDCGGWDAGCPLTVLGNNNKSNNLTDQNPAAASAFELFVEGSKQDDPTVQVVNVRDDIYLTYFQPGLSTLQCFAVAVAMMHSRTPGLRPQL